MGILAPGVCLLGRTRWHNLIKLKGKCTQAPVEVTYSRFSASFPRTRGPMARGWMWKKPHESQATVVGSSLVARTSKICCKDGTSGVLRELDQGRNVGDGVSMRFGFGNVRGLNVTVCAESIP